MHFSSMHSGDKFRINFNPMHSPSSSSQSHMQCRYSYLLEINEFTYFTIAPSLHPKLSPSRIPRQGASWKVIIERNATVIVMGKLRGLLFACTLFHAISYAPLNLINQFASLSRLLISEIWKNMSIMHICTYIGAVLQSALACDNCYSTERMWRYSVTKLTKLTLLWVNWKVMWCKLVLISHFTWRATNKQS